MERPRIVRQTNGARRLASAGSGLLGRLVRRHRPPPWRAPHKNRCCKIDSFSVSFRRPSCLPDLQSRPKQAKHDVSMKFATIIDRDEDGVWVVQCPSVPGCVSQGKTRAEALKNIKEAIELCLEVRAERGMPLTVETSQVEVSL